MKKVLTILLTTGFLAAGIATLTSTPARALDWQCLDQCDADYWSCTADTCACTDALLRCQRTCY